MVQPLRSGRVADIATEVETDRNDARSSRQELAFAIRVVGGPDKGSELLLDHDVPGPVFVGTSETCTLRLSDARVSRRHLALERRSPTLRVRDLDSTNGTFVDRVRVVAADLTGGEYIRLGSTMLLVEARPTGVHTEMPSATSFGRIIGSSVEMRARYPLYERLAVSHVPVVIEGETGTGKELLAESLHEMGPRSGGPFVVFDCTAVAPTLVETELFGHERGAFTGAVRDHPGVFEQANGGTLLIDEIGDLDLALQAKLLRVIERAELRRVGGKDIMHRRSHHGCHASGSRSGSRTRALPRRSLPSPGDSPGPSAIAKAARRRADSRTPLLGAARRWRRTTLTTSVGALGQCAMARQRARIAQRGGEAACAGRSAVESGRRGRSQL